MGFCLYALSTIRIKGRLISLLQGTLTATAATGELHGAMQAW